jgi:tripartite-type tricarboxylate transporter receptor subunit TctC
MVKALNAPDVRQRLEELGLDVTPQTPEQFAALIKSDNKPGANTFIAAEAAARTPADGYTLFTPTPSTMVWNGSFARGPFATRRISRRSL